MSYKFFSERDVQTAKESLSEFIPVTGTIVSVNLATSGGAVQIIATGDANPTSGSGQWVQLRLFRDGDAIEDIIDPAMVPDGIGPVQYRSIAKPLAYDMDPREL